MSEVQHPTLREVAASNRLLKDFTVHTCEVDHLHGVDPIQAYMIDNMCEAAPPAHPSADTRS